jgi:hypothetical protein
MKETFYLRHDYNSRNDEKILKLRREYPDGSGYAIYWMLLEKLAESSEGRLKLSDIENIAFDLRFSCERIADVINQYMLFENDNTFFWSNRLLSDLAERDEKSKQGKLAAKIRWDKERKKMQTHCNGNADAMQGKERKGKKGKEGKADKGITGEQETLFIRFWDLYPNKKARKAARKAFDTAARKVPIETMLKALAEQKQSADWKKDGGQYIPHASTWLNGERWNDQVPLTPKDTWI